MKATTIAAAIVLGGFVFAWLAVHRPPDPMACPGGLRADPARAAAIVGLLRRTDQGAPLLRREPQPLRLCFTDEGAGVVRSDGVFVLAATGDQRAAAARLGHLLHHQIFGEPLREPLDPARSCGELVAAAMQAEAEAHALELHLRRALGVTRPLHDAELETAFWAAAPPDRVGVMHRFLTGADGRPARPALQSAYARRCASLRGSDRER